MVYVHIKKTTSLLTIINQRSLNNNIAMCRLYVIVDKFVYNFFTIFTKKLYQQRWVMNELNFEV